MTDAVFDEAALLRLAAEARRFMWVDPSVRRKLQAQHVNIVPSNFYSTVPSVDDIYSSFEGWPDPEPVYLEIFDRPFMATFLETMSRHAAEFDAPAHGNPDTCTSFFWENTQFSSLDAVAYYCMVRRIKPRRIIEIGSGFSTLVADAAIRANGVGEIVSIEPFPRPFLRKIESLSALHMDPVQKIPLSALIDLADSADMIFIDSTHTVKIGSDCLYIYLRFLPAIRKRIVIHSHDIFLPFGMPASWALEHHIYWTEQYLVCALLLQNAQARVLFGSRFCQYAFPEKARALMKGKAASSGAGGGSLWYELNRVGPQSA